MLSLLSRYIITDLGRVLALTTVVLVVVIAFGATIKPLTSDQLIGWWQMVKYITLVMIPMLQFSLPFAAGFASTLVMHRMAGDNEILAAAASGISYRRIFMPVAILGLVLLLIMFALTQWIIPRSWSLIRSMVADDVVKLFESSIKRGQPFVLGDQQIYAEHLEIMTPDDPDVDVRLVLFGIVAAELDEGGKISSDITANHAVIDVYRRPAGTYLNFVLIDANRYDYDNRQFAQTPTIRPDPFVMPSDLVSTPMTMTRGTLLDLRNNPDRDPRLMREKLRLAHALYRDDVDRSMQDELMTQQRVRLTGSGSSPLKYVVRAEAVERGRFRRPGDLIEVDEFEGDTPVRRFRAKRVKLEEAPANEFGVPTSMLLLTGVLIEDMRTGETGEKEEWPISGITYGRVDAPDADGVPLADMLARARAIDQPDKDLVRVVEAVTHRLESTRNHIDGQLWQRYALTVSAPLLLLLGATLAVWRKDSLPLSIYLLAFVPSILAIIMVSGGVQMMKDGQRTVGFLSIWSGDVGLLILLLIAFFRLSRN